ncbi:siderophore-interacting protein [Sphingomonas sp. PvP056]|uniref:siderophore-interacting protein n=1 Tax=Sphingomonas sp. PvP056 TaxID=3156392 RepID=UPI0033953499
MANSAGALSRAFARVIARRATIVTTEKLGHDLVVITLEAPGFKGVKWTPGEKVQIAMSSIFETRTYTPFEWDRDMGRLRILGFLHGSGPGCDWLRTARAGDSCDVLGPRHSLTVGPAEGPVAFFGDETSVAFAYALSREGRNLCSCFVEVRNAESTHDLCKQWNLNTMNVVARTANESHLNTLRAALPALADEGATFILTGKAQTIQHLQAGLKDLNVQPRRIMSKAYWSPGKTGLD